MNLGNLKGAIKGAILSGVFLTGSAAAISVDENFEGQWFNGANDNGTGWQFDYIKIGPEIGQLFVTGFVYGDDGNPTWVTGSTNVLAGESNFKL